MLQRNDPSENQNQQIGWMDGWIDIHRQNEKWIVDIKYIGIYKSIGLNSSRKLVHLQVNLPPEKNTILPKGLIKKWYKKLVSHSEAGLLNYRSVRS